MSVLSHSRAASVPSGAAALYRSLAAWYARMRGGIFLVALAAGVLAGLGAGRESVRRLDRRAALRLAGCAGRVRRAALRGLGRPG